MTSKRIVGPFYDVAYSVLHKHEEYGRFGAGALSRADYASFIDRIAPALVEAGLPADDVQFAKRYPRSAALFVDDCLNNLVTCGVLKSASYNTSLFELMMGEIRRSFDHGPFTTYIYPEELRLLFAIADIIKPRAAVFLGSYYGYWAYPTIASIAGNNGSVVLVDPDSIAQAVARRNLADSPYRDAVEIVVGTGENYLDRGDANFDLIVLDAEGPRTHEDPEQRGKRVYSSLLRHSLPRTSDSTFLVCHNILFDDHSGSRFFDQIIRRNRDELGPFMEIVRREFPNFHECASTEGVGVGSRHR